jgi:plasmid stabilization system protein ParE
VIRLVITLEAERDVADLLAYLEQTANEIIAEEFGQSIRRVLMRLAQFQISDRRVRTWEPTSAWC